VEIGEGKLWKWHAYQIKNWIASPSALSKMSALDQEMLMTVLLLFQEWLLPIIQLILQ